MNRMIKIKILCQIIYLSHKTVFGMENENMQNNVEDESDKRAYHSNTIMAVLN